MKYKIFLFAVCIFTLNYAKSQQNSGVVKYKITTNYEKVILNSTDNKEEAENMLYSWRSDWKIRTTTAEVKFSPKATIYTEEENPDEGRQSEYIIYSDNENKKSYDVIRMLGNLYVIDDTLTNYKWKITNGMKEIVGHICMSATIKDTIKNQDITAWFALDLPLPYGPDMYFGLPGMILEIDICNGSKVYSAQSITFSDEPIEIAKPTHKRKCKILTYNQYMQEIYNIIQDFKKKGHPYIWFIRF